jgi:hypothetical protein
MEDALRASSLQQQRRFRPNVLVQVWRRWIAAPADQLLEVARLGSDKLEYLTCDPEMPKSDGNRRHRSAPSRVLAGGDLTAWLGW